MEFTTNVLPIDSNRWLLTNATMTPLAISLQANGEASCTLTHDDVLYTPTAFKCTIKYRNLDSTEFDPTAHVKLLIKDNNGVYQTITAPFSQSVIFGTDEMVAILYTSVADFEDLIFYIYAEQAVEITEWKLFPSSSIDSSALNQINSLLPHFLYYFNETAINVYGSDLQVANIPINMGEVGNLSCHFLMTFTASHPCIIQVSIKLDGTVEPYCPVLYPVMKGANYIGLPHSFLEVPAAPHLATIDIKVLPPSAALNDIAGNVVIAPNASAEYTGNFKFVDTQQASITIGAKALRYTIEGRGILNGASGEYPHAEASATYPWNVHLDTTPFEFYGEASGRLVDIDRFNKTEVYEYHPIDATGFSTVGGLDSFGSGKVSIWNFNTATADTTTIIGNGGLDVSGVVISAGTELIVYSSMRGPIDEVADYAFYINGFEFKTLAGTYIALALSVDAGVTWQTLDGDLAWQTIDLTYAAMLQSALTDVVARSLPKARWEELIGNSTDVRIAVYVRNNGAGTIISSVSMYYANSYAAPQSLDPPTDLVAIPEDKAVRLSWLLPELADYYVRIYYGTSPTALTETFDTQRSAMLSAIFNLTNNTTYYFKIAGFIDSVESPATPIVAAIPSLKVPTLTRSISAVRSVKCYWTVIGISYDYYNIYIGTTVDNLQQALQVDGVFNEAIIEGLITDTTYYVAVTGLLGVEESMPSNIIEVATNSTVTLTSYGKQGRSVPTQVDADAALAPVEVISGIQKYTVESTGNYAITAQGGCGGKGDGSTPAKCYGGFGAIVSGTFALMQGDELYCLVGQKATDNATTSGDGTTGAGGGMSVVAVKDDLSTDVLTLGDTSVNVRLLLCAGAGNGGGDERYSGVAGADALLTEGTSDAYLTADYAGGGYAAYKPSAYNGSSFLAGGAAATSVYSRSGSSAAGFGGGGANQDDGNGGGGGGYRGGIRSGQGGSSYNADANGTATLATERVGGHIIIQEVQ